MPGDPLPAPSRGRGRHLGAKGLTAAAAVPPIAWTWRHLHSAAVSAWSAPALPGVRSGPLFVRHGGTGARGFLLLHGILSSGDVFGRVFETLASEGRLFVPDLLGFGRSLDTGRTSFPPEAHLDALDRSLADLPGAPEGWTLGAHSMGASVALRWALRHPELVKRVVCWGAPVQPSPEAARTAVAGSMMLRLFALDTRWAETACRWNCRHRTTAGWLSALAEPSLPVPVARAASLHTWPAFRDAVDHLVIDTDWSGLIAGVNALGIPVHLVWGRDDPTYDRILAGDLAQGDSLVTTDFRDRGGHRLPLTDPGGCLGDLRSAVYGPLR